MDVVSSGKSPENREQIERLNWMIALLKMYKFFCREKYPEKIPITKFVSVVLFKDEK